MYLLNSGFYFTTSSVGTFKLNQNYLDIFIFATAKCTTIYFGTKPSILGNKSQYNSPATTYNITGRWVYYFIAGICDLRLF